MANLLETLGFKKKVRVGISVSVNNFVELVCVDDATHSLVRYASSKIKYNTAIREIMDFDEFNEVVDGLFAEAGLHPSECAVTLVLPNVHFGITYVEANYEKPYLEENILTEIEDLYIFKRSEPAIAYSELEASKVRNQVNVAYTAMQSVVLGRILGIFDAMQAEVVRIDNSYSAFLKTMQYCDRFSKYFEKEEKTAILLLTQGNCAAFCLNGNELIDFSEEALAVKSLSTEEVYSTISKIASGMISKNSPRTLLVVSETDEVNAEQLLAGLDFAGDTDFFNKGIGSTESFIDITGSQHEVDPNMVSYLTLEAVGAAVADYMDYPLDINFLPQERRNTNIIKVGGYEIDLVRFVIIVLGAAVLGGFALGGIVKGIVSAKINMFQNTTDQAEADYGVFKKKIDDNKADSNKNAEFPLLKSIVDNQTKIIDTYNILSTDVIDGVYIKRFMANAKGDMGIYGVAKSTELASDFSTKIREHNNALLFSSVSIDPTQDIFASAIGQNDGINFELKTIDFNPDDLAGAIEDLNNSLEQMNNSFSQQNFENNNNLMAPPPPVI